MKKWKKNMMAAAVLLVVCLGIYVNWIFTSSEQAGDLTDVLDAQKVMSADGLILDGDELVEDAERGGAGHLPRHVYV